MMTHKVGNYFYGQKVVPFQKTAWGPLNECSSWHHQGGKRQGFLYVLERRPLRGTMVYELSASKDGGRDFFNEEDFHALEKGNKALTGILREE